MDFKSYLSRFSTTSLDEMNAVKLMNRSDQKFAFSISKLPELLIELTDFYNILEVDDKKVQSYKSIYYDTNDRVFFIKHHNSRVNRNKVRFREYLGSGLVFLEVKLKNNKGKTVKTRIKVDSIPDSLSKEHKAYIYKQIGEDLDLLPQQSINFNRITLVDKSFTERLTIDTALEFSNKGKSDCFSSVVIAELKKERSSNSSKFTRIAKNKHILPVRISKYCMSTIMLEKSIKQNRFKEKLLLLNKLNQL